MWQQDQVEAVVTKFPTCDAVASCQRLAFELLRTDYFVRLSGVVHWPPGEHPSSFESSDEPVTVKMRTYA